MQHALVEEPIGSVVLTSDTERFIATDTVVTFNNTVASGNNLTFTWKFNDGLSNTIEKYCQSILSFSPLNPGHLYCDDQRGD